MDTFFTTERLTVRRFQPSDSADLAEILTDPNVTFFEPYETFTAEQCVQETVNFSQSSEFFAVVLNGKVIGKIYFSAREYGTYEIGWTFSQAYQGHGYAAESIRGMMQYAFTELGVRRIIAQIDTRNQKSRRLAERVGMRQETEHKQLYPQKDKESSRNKLLFLLVCTALCCVPRTRITQSSASFVRLAQGSASCASTINLFLYDS